MKNLWSQSRLAAEFDLDRRTIKKRLEGVRPCGQVRGNDAWTLKVAVPYIVESLEASDEEEQLSASDRNKLYDAELKYIKLERERGNLVYVWEMQRQLGEVVGLFVQSLDIMPDVLERDGILKPAQVEPFRQRLDVLREELHRELVDVDEH